MTLLEIKRPAERFHLLDVARLQMFLWSSSSVMVTSRGDDCLKM